MINLLPPEGHRAVKQEYFFRAGASVLLLFSCVGIFLTVAFIPTYVLVGAQIKAFEGTEKSNPDTSVVTEVDMKETEDLLKQLKKTSERQTTNSLIKKIEETASSEIMFKTFRIDMNKGTTTIQVQGIAETREALAQFKNALVATDVFEKADVPISDLARETDLPFMITIVPKSKN